jgi:hypothetical protein
MIRGGGANGPSRGMVCPKKILVFFSYSEKWPLYPAYLFLFPPHIQPGKHAHAQITTPEQKDA